MLQFLIFAGTTEGRGLAELLARPDCALTACVATEYGREALPEQPNLTVLAGRRGAEEIAALLGEVRYDCVFDATHPYAAAATENIRAACERAGTPYLRVLRAGGVPQAGCTFVNSAEEAAEYLAKTTGPVLLTTGSKELNVFAAVPNYRERLYVRVLPSVDSVERCLALGVPSKHIIGMQGPFSEELNTALLRQIGAGWLVTKDSGDAGGFAQKCAAARRAGAELVVIGRPPQAEGAAPEELPRILRERWGLLPVEQTEEAFFPLFVSLKNKVVVVVGAGKIAARRIDTLLGFGCRLQVVSPKACGAVRALAQAGRLEWRERAYRAGDCAEAALVVAATDSRAVNHGVFEECEAAKIPHSVADCKAECSFYFPGVAQSGGLVVGVTASGKNHRLAAQVTKEAQKLVCNLALKKEVCPFE